MILLDSFFKQAILISFLGHIALFTMFTFSFGPKIPEINFAQVSFRGAILRGVDLMSTPKLNERHKTAGAAIRKSEAFALERMKGGYSWRVGDYTKPPAPLIFNKDKIFFMRKTTPRLFISKRKEPTIMFYPKLPYHFALYFKDRQVAHIELLFEVIFTGEKSSVAVKRKISSGNLEADLLSMRYISRYLFIQQMAFAPDNWQTVKIDLSRLND